MTALYMDGFNHYGSNAQTMLDGAWAEIGGLLGTPPFGARTGALAFGSNAAETGGRYVLPSSEDEIFVSLGFAVNSLPQINNRNEIISFHDSGNVKIATLYLETTGALQLLASNDTTVLAETQGPVIVAGNWHFLEMDFNQGSGAFTLRIDDPTASNTPTITATGLSLGSNEVAQIEVITAHGSNVSQAWAADLFIRNTSGSINNSWLGDRRIATLLADADTTTMGWTPRYYHKLGAGILNLTGTDRFNAGFNSLVSSPDSGSLNIGASDFTIESFIRFESLPTSTHKAVIFGKWDETHDQRSYQLFYGSQALNNSSLCFQTSTDGSVSTVAQPIIYPWTPELDTWYNIAIVRAAGELLLFVDGQQLGLPIADSTTYFAGTAPLGIGGQAESGSPGFLINSMFTGWFDETRFTNGVGRYTTNFTPTTVEFPRSSSDPDWTDVVLLAGYDSQIQDESTFTRTLSAFNNAVQQTTNDGPSVGVWSTVGKLAPDDNSFAEAPFVAASNILTLSAQPAANDTVTVGTSDGTTAAVYKFVSSVTTAFDVLIDTSLQQTLQNLYNAINAGAGSGTKYGTGTTSNFDVIASQLPAGQLAVTALLPGTAGNSIASTVSLTHGGAWASTTLLGGLAIPGPSNFKVQRPPNDTTIISAVQVVTRSFKSDAGIGTFNTSLIGPLGGSTTDSTHSLTVSPVFYSDMYEIDPDTSGPISPTTIVNGAIQINRVS